MAKVPYESIEKKSTSENTNNPGKSSAPDPVLKTGLPNSGTDGMPSNGTKRTPY